MSFFEPARLLWGLLASLVIAAYLIRRRRIEHELATLQLWQQAIAMRSFWRRCRKTASLAGVLAIVGGLTFAMGEPFWTTTFEARRNVVIVLDNSPSMSATDVEPTRLEHASSQASRFVSNLGRYDSVGLLSTGGPTRVLSGLSQNHETIRDLLQRVDPDEGGASLDETIELARGMLANRHNPTMVVFSDRRPSGDDLTWVPSVGSGDNVGITRLEVRARGAFTRGLFVEVTNFGDHDVACELSLSCSDSVESRIPLNLAAGQSLEQAIALPTPATVTDRIEAWIDREDDWMDDNRAIREIVSTSSRRLFCFGTDRKRLFDASMSISAESRSSQVPSEFPEGSIVLIDGEIPDRFPDCPTLVINPRTSCDYWTFEDEVSGGTVESANVESPLLRNINLHDVVLGPLAELRFLSEHQTILETNQSQPVITSIDRDGVPLIVIHSPLVGRELSRRAMLVELLSNFVALCDERPERTFAAMARHQVSDEGNLRGEAVAERLKPPATSPAGPPLWVPLAGIGLGLIVIQWLTYQRRLTV